MGADAGLRNRATVTNKAGESTRVMAASRLAVAFALLILIWLGIVIYRAEPVILFTNAFVKVRGKAKGVEVVSLKYLPRFLERLPDKITVPEAGRIYNRIKAATK